MKNIFFSLWVLVFLLSCYEEERGCFDQLSNNLSLTADRACTDCCTYPTVSVSFYPTIGGQPYSKDMLLSFSSDEVRIEKMIMFLSDWTFFINGNSRQVGERYSVYGESEDLVNDIVVFEANFVKKDIGTLRDTGTISKISVYPGIEHVYKVIDDNVILKNYEEQYSGSGYYDIYLVVNSDNSPYEHNILKIHNVTNTDMEIQTNNLYKEKKKDINIDLELQMDDLLKNIQVNWKDSAQIIQTNINQFIKQK